jgi:hypothetical protein
MSTPTPSSQQSKPWYRYPWVWFFISFPLTSICVGIFWITLSVKHQVALVSDDWYKDGLGINQDLKAIKLAKLLNIEITQVSLENKQLDFSVTAPSEAFYTSDYDIVVFIQHPTDPKLDYSQRLKPTSDIELAEASIFQLNYSTTLPSSLYAGHSTALKVSNALPSGQDTQAGQWETQYPIKLTQDSSKDESR